MLDAISRSCERRELMNHETRVLRYVLRYPLASYQDNFGKGAADSDRSAGFEDSLSHPYAIVRSLLAFQIHMRQGFPSSN
jgi:hypothetical protein